jgi:hypothetical protein
MASTHQRVLVANFSRGWWFLSVARKESASERERAKKREHEEEGERKRDEERGIES